VSRASVLRSRPFRLYWLGQTLSRAGSSLSAVALAFAVFAVSRSATSLAVVLVAGQLPVIAFTLLGGVLGDRCSRRAIMLGSDAARTLLQALTAGLLLSGTASVAALAVLQGAAGIASAMFQPAAGGLVANLAPAGRVREANSLLGASASAAQIGALALSGVLVAGLGAGAAFVVDAASYAASTVSLALIPAAALSAATAPSGGVLRELAAGWRAVRERSWLIVNVVHVAFLNALVIAPFFVLGPLVAERRLGGAPAWAAIVFGYAVGTLAAAGITLHWHPARPLLAALISTVALVPLLLLLANGVGLLWCLVPAAVAAGAQADVYSTLTTSCLQANVPDRLLSRASAFESFGSVVGVPIGMGCAAAAAGAVGSGAVLTFAAAWLMLSALAAGLVPDTRARLALSVSAQGVREETGAGSSGTAPNATSLPSGSR
jgi:MFS family permease